MKPTPLKQSFCLLALNDQFRHPPPHHPPPSSSLKVFRKIDFPIKVKCNNRESLVASQLLIYTLKNTGGSAGCVRSGKGGKLQINDSAAPSAAQSLIYKKYIFIHTIYFLGVLHLVFIDSFFSPTAFSSVTLTKGACRFVN